VQTNSTSASRLITTAGCILAVVLGGWCLLWYASAHPSSSDQSGFYQFLGVAFVGLAAGVAALLAARRRRRWLLLLVLLPVSLVFCERAWELWSWSYRRGVFPYFLFLIPSALVAFALRAVARRFTGAWPPAATMLALQNMARASLHALPFAVVFAPMWVRNGDFSFLIPASAFLFIPGFGGIWGAAPSDSWGILVASASLATFWLLIALVFLRSRPRPLAQEIENG